MGEILGYDQKQIRRRARRLGVQFGKVKRDRAWTEEEDARIRELVATKTVNQIAEELGRTRASVSHYLRGNGLKIRMRVIGNSPSPFRLWTEAERDGSNPVPLPYCTVWIIKPTWNPQ